jgi:hypothetical protein
MNETDLTDEVRDAMHRYYASSVLRNDLSRRVLNKCPHLSNKLRYVRAIFPDARFIHIIREPVAMVASWVKLMRAVPELMLYWPEAEYPCFWVLPVKEAAKRGHVLAREPRFYPGGGPMLLANYWATVNANVSRQLSDTSDQLLTVRYEDLIAQPDQELEQIARFCNLRFPPTHRPAIKKDRNVLYRSLLTEAEEVAIRERTATVAESFGYRPLQKQ